VLQETITAKSPFVRATRAETVSAILTEAAPSLKQFDPAIPAELDQVVKRCLNKEPDQRFQSAGDLAFHLRQILNTLSSPSATTQVGRRAARFNGRTAQAAAAAVVVLLFLSAFGHWIGARRSSVVRPQFKSIAVLPCRTTLVIRSKIFCRRHDGFSDCRPRENQRHESHLTHLRDAIQKLEKIVARNCE
jgi:serine/threonine protein kinase